MHLWMSSRFGMSAARRPAPSSPTNSISSNKIFMKKRRAATMQSTNSKGTKLISIGRETEPDAPWRIENVMADGCPKDNDWWDEVTVDDDVNGSECPDKDRNGNIEKEIESTAENSRFNNEHLNDRGDKQITESRTFINVGLENWEKARKEWRKCRVQERQPKPPPVRYEKVVKGLTQVQSTFELPGRMTLPDIVDVFVDIWECERDY